MTRRRREVTPGADSAFPNSPSRRQLPATRQRTFAIEARHNSADEVLYLAHEKISGPQDVGIAKLLQIVTRPSAEPTSVKRATASAKGQRRG
jgi:hypothetical protein